MGLICGKKFEKNSKIRVQIDDLSSDLLKYIMEFLPEKQLFQLQRVSKKWQKCVLQLLERRDSFSFWIYYSSKFYYGINDDNIDIIKSILTKYPNIKHLDISSSSVNNINNLFEMIKLLPKIESIDLTWSMRSIPDHEMEKFVKLISPKLIKCKLCNRVYENSIKFQHLKHLKNLQEISFITLTLDEANQIFHHLNTECLNLKILKWEFQSEPMDFYNFAKFYSQDMANVMRRIENLQITLPIITRFNFNMPNLTQLTIDGSLRESLKIELEFANLVKLNLNNFDNSNYDSILKFKFPKLESVSINPSSTFIPSEFIQRIKYINSFNYLVRNDFSLPIERLINLTNLFIIFSINHVNDYTQILLFIHELSISTLQNIKIQIDDYDMLIKQDFYYQLGKLCNAKPNTKINIFIIHEDLLDENFIHYKKVFEEAKHLYKLSMKLNN